MAYFKSTLYNSNNQLDFEVSPDLGEKTGREFANQMSESLGGVEYVFQPHSGKRTWSFNWSNISSTFQGQLKDFRDAVGGNYNSFTYHDGSTAYTVRMSPDSLQFSENQYTRYSTSIKLREVSPS
jgi:hypothetical protein